MRSDREEIPYFSKKALIFLFLPWILALLIISNLHASQSIVVEVDGFACMGYDKSRKQTEEEALANAKKKAVEHTSTYVKSESRVKDFELERDLVEAYSNATVKVIDELSRAWHRDVALGDCCQIRVKAEVVPDNEAMERISKGKVSSEDPTAPLNVQLWTDRGEYKETEKIKIYMRGNKPFYARILHRSVDGEVLQLLPNPYRPDHYFNGGAIYEVPSGPDRFEMEVTPPFGEENITVYASTAPLGEIDLVPAGAVYKVRTESENIGPRSKAVSLDRVTIRSRGVSLKEKNPEQKITTAEFSETQVTFKTGK